MGRPAAGSNFTGAGNLYIAATHQTTPNTKTKPGADELGGANRPIVFPLPSKPAVTATVDGQSVKLSWTRASGSNETHYRIYQSTASPVDISGNGMVVDLAAANCPTTDTTRTCEVTIPNLDSGDYHFRVLAINDSHTTIKTGRRGLEIASDEDSAMVVAPITPLALSDPQNLAGNTRTLAVNAQDISIALGGATGGDGSAKTYGLTKTAGNAADLMALGLQIQQTGSGPITITNLAGGAIAGSITLRYEVDDTSDAATANFSFTITVTADPALNIVGGTSQTVAPDTAIAEIRVEAVNFADATAITYALLEGESGGGTGTANLRGLTVSGNATTTATITGTPKQNVTFRLVANVDGEDPVRSEPITIRINTPNAAPAPAESSSSSSGGIVALAIIGAGAYYWWKKRQIQNGNAAKMALLPDVSFDLDRNDERAFYTKMNWQNAGNSNWQLRSNLALHTKYSGRLLDWNANSHIGYRLKGKFGEFNPYLHGKFVQNAPENAEMQKTYSFGLNYAIPKRFSVQIVQPDSEISRFSVKTQWYLPKGIGLQLNQPNSDLKNYGFGVQWRGKSKIRYGLHGETGGNLYRLSGEFWF